jgi:DNA-binding transcriptional ArsR family regulator
MLLLHHPPAASIRLAGILHALADPARLAFVRVLTEVSDGINCADTLAKAGLSMPKSTCSHHFQILRRAGVVFSQRRGVELINFLRADDLEGRFPGMLTTILAASEEEERVAAGVA